MTQTLIRLAPIEAVQVPPQPRFTEDELRAIFADSCGPLVDPFPRWPGLWHQSQSTASIYIRASEHRRLGADIPLATMATYLRRGGYINHPTPEIPQQQRAAMPVEFPKWVR